MDSIFKDKYVVVIGVFEKSTRPAVIDKLREHGAKLTLTVNKRVDFVITGRLGGRRLADAEHYGIRIIKEDELLNLLNRGTHDQADQPVVPLT